jgi:hypothetical protein
MSETLDALRVVLGSDAGVRALCRMLGGELVRFTNTDSDAFVVLDKSVLAKLAKHFGNELIYIPQPDIAADRRVAARLLRGQNFTLREIGLRLHITERHVARLLVDPDIVS